MKTLYTDTLYNSKILYSVGSMYRVLAHIYTGWDGVGAVLEFVRGK